MSSPAQSFTHELNPVAGWPNPYALVKSGVQLASTTVNTATCYAGMVGHLYTGAGADRGKLALGVPAPYSGIAPMPLFIFQNEGDFDAVGDDGNLVGAPASGTSNIAKLNCLVATGGFELETTEFIYSNLQTGSLLIAVNSGGNLGRIQSLINGLAPSPTTIIGVVSDGAITNDHPGGYQRLRFWSCFIPVMTLQGGNPGLASSSSSSAHA